MVDTTETQPLSYRRIFWFWIPLAAMWFMMALEQPLIAISVARMPFPKENLAAYGVIFSLALIIESPIIMLLATGTALSRGAQSYHRLLRFSHRLIVSLTALHLLVGLTPLFDLILARVIGVSGRIVELGRPAFLALTPWTAAVGYRRLWQGVLIRYERTGVVPITIAVRLVVTAGVLLLGYALGRYSGVLVGSAALSAGVLAAAGAAFLFVRPVVRQHLHLSIPETMPLARKELTAFYVPLALTSLILLAARPLLTLAISRLPEALDSLAVWPVILSVSFLGRSIAMSYQEAGIALLQSRGSFTMLLRFVRILGLVMFLVFAVFAVTPLSGLWFRRIVGLPADLAQLARVPMLFVAILPAAGAWISWKRAVLVSARVTPAITRSVVVNLLVLAGLLLLLGYTLRLSGVLIASMAYAGSMLAEWLYLQFAAARAYPRLFPSGSK